MVGAFWATGGKNVLSLAIAWHAYSQPRRKLILARVRGGWKAKMEGLADAVMNAAARGTGIGSAVQGRVRNAAQKNGRDDELR